MGGRRAHNLKMSLFLDIQAAIREVASENGKQRDTAVSSTNYCSFSLCSYIPKKLSNREPSADESQKTISLFTLIFNIVVFFLLLVCFCVSAVYRLPVLSLILIITPSPSLPSSKPAHQSVFSHTPREGTFAPWGPSRSSEELLRYLVLRILALTDYR